jgi:hypothetical protein
MQGGCRYWVTDNDSRRKGCLQLSFWEVMQALAPCTRVVVEASTGYAGAAPCTRVRGQPLLTPLGPILYMPVPHSAGYAGACALRPR